MQRTTRRRYTDDFKARAVALAESTGPVKAARQLGISAKTLANWLGASRADQPLSSPNRKPVSEMESELARLRVENATLKMEREILKSDGVLRQGVQVRHAFVAHEQTRYPLRILCRVLAVSVSGFHDGATLNRVVSSRGLRIQKYSYEFISFTKLKELSSIFPRDRTVCVTKFAIGKERYCRRDGRVRCRLTVPRDEA